MKTVHQSDKHVSYRPLTSATEAGHTEIVKISLTNGASIGKFDLRTAVRAGYSEINKLLLNHGAIIDPTDRDLYHEEVLKAIRAGDPAFAQALITAGASAGPSGLMLAEAYGYIY